MTILIIIKIRKKMSEKHNDVIQVVRM